MVAHLTMRTHGVNQAFRFVDGIWLHRKSRQIRNTSILHTCVTCSELPSYISTMATNTKGTILWQMSINSDCYV